MVRPSDSGERGSRVIHLPQLSPSFWESHDVLRHIARAARAEANPASPDAVLGVCLCRVSAITPIETTLPGVGGTLNYLVGLVGPSGAGKSTAQRIARRLIPEIGTDLDSIPIGSGEGLIECYLRTTRVKDDNGETRAEKVQQHTSAYFYVDEAETFIAKKRQDASTTLATLRSMWSGSDVGSTNASHETTRRLKDGTYRFAAAMGFQPKYTVDLMRDDAAGTPQRFLFVSALDRYAVEVPSSYPGPLHVPTPRRGPIHVDPEVERIVRTRRIQHMRGEVEVDPLDTHRDLLQLRTAAHLAALCGDPASVSAFWWNLANEVVETSRAIRGVLYDHDREIATAEKVQRVEDRIATDEMIRERNAARISANLGRAARRLGPKPFQTLVNQLASRDRLYADLDDAIRRGMLAPGKAANDYVAGPNVDNA